MVSALTTNIEGENIKAVLFTLRSEKSEQVALNLVFGYDVPIKFAVSGGDGKGVVHISGYYQPGPDEEDEGDEMEDYDDEEDGKSTHTHYLVYKHTQSYSIHY